MNQNEPRATTRAIWHAQSAERVAQAISKWAPRHDESDLTRPKCREGCTSHLKMSTPPQWERSDRPKVRRRLRERSPNSHSATARAIRDAQSDERVAQAHVRFSTKHCVHHEKWTLKSQKHCITYSIRQNYGQNVTLGRWAPVYHAFFRNCVFHIFPIILSAGTHPPIRTLNAFWRVLNPWASGIDPGQQTCTLFGWFSKSEFFIEVCNIFWDIGLFANSLIWNLMFSIGFSFAKPADFQPAVFGSRFSSLNPWQRDIAWAGIPEPLPKGINVNQGWSQAHHQTPAWHWPRI